MKPSLAHPSRRAIAALREGVAETDRTARLRRFQEYLTLETRRLQSWHAAGAGGCELAAARSRLMDVLLRALVAATLRETGARGASAPSFCLVATGGYGRGELNPFSDVDLLFLLGTAKEPELSRANATVEQILYALWDLGLKIGHATRTREQCLATVTQDMKSGTALLEARLLHGDGAAYATFDKALAREGRRHADAYVEARAVDQARRHEKFGNTVFVQEPNVKNGCGGLRDVQNLLWIARARWGARTLGEIVRGGHLLKLEAGRLQRAYDFLMRVRNQLHYMHGRANDDLPLAIQPKVAEALGHRQRNVLVRIEEFMRDYYRHGRDIFVLTEALGRRFGAEARESRRRAGLGGFFGKKSRAQPVEGGLLLRDGTLVCTSASEFPRDAREILLAFRSAQVHVAALGADVLSRVRQNLKLVTREFLYSTRSREIFFSIMSSKGEVGRILRAMHECGFLGAYLPEFGRLDCLVQHEFYHRYTADEHTLVAIEKLDETLEAQEGAAAAYGRIFRPLEDAHLLYLALLLHDTGKATGVRRHSEASAECAARVARRLCLDRESARVLLWLVDHHGTMASLVARRDLEDPEVIEDFMRLVGSRLRLDMLHLLTWVDGLAVGSGAWNEWRQTLLWQLYQETAQALETSGVARVDADARRIELRKTLASAPAARIPDDELDAHFALMPARYWTRVEPDELDAHLQTIHEFLEGLAGGREEDAAAVVRWRPFVDRGYTEVAVCSWDRHGLFARIAGAFAATRINILSADIYTRGDRLALDLFHVCDLDHRAVREEARLARMREILRALLEGKLEKALPEVIHEEYASMRRMPHQGEELFPTRITFDNEDSDRATILEIVTPDRLGLLYHVLDELSRANLDVGLARITTEKGAAMDAFYLTDREGRKIADEDRLREVATRLRARIDELNRPFRNGK
ncbi:MAG: [protein-PII] uridylyltransferase [Verrucomicrobiae bacterium]|nr:[protein-PII] uridylyltransferase [Verrucomicrobiae bacterium]